jgi:hypothetical protein
MEKKTMTQPIYLVGGGKGGVGKSMMSMALARLPSTAPIAPPSWSRRARQLPMSGRPTRNDVENQCIDLEQKDGWLELLDVIGRTPDTRIVINSKAANQAGLRRFGGMLTEALEQQSRELVVLWSSTASATASNCWARSWTVSARTNASTPTSFETCTGEESKFDLYNASDLRKQIEDRGGTTLNFLDVADRVSEAINRQRMPTSTLPWRSCRSGRGIELSRWQLRIQGHSRPGHPMKTLEDAFTSSSEGNPPIRKGKTSTARATP